MRLRQLALALTLALPIAALPGCANSTTVEQVWRAPEWSASFDHVVIFGLSKRPGVRRAFETEVAAILSDAGVRASPSFELFPGDTEHSDEEIAQILATEQVDGVLTARLLAIDKQQRYVEGSPYVVTGGARRGFYGYYHSTYGVIHSPGYTIEYDVVTLESNLYEVASGELVWSALSETFAPKDVDEVISSYAKAMSTTLLDAGLVAPAAE